MFSEEEIEKVYSAGLNYQQISGYNDLSPEGRDRWKGYTSMSLGKPKNEVKPADWEKVDNWKNPESRQDEYRHGVSTHRGGEEQDELAGP